MNVPKVARIILVLGIFLGVATIGTLPITVRTSVPASAEGPQATQTDPATTVQVDAPEHTQSATAETSATESTSPTTAAEPTNQPQPTATQQQGAPISFGGKQLCQGGSNLWEWQVHNLTDHSLQVKVELVQNGKQIWGGELKSGPGNETYGGAISANDGPPEGDLKFYADGVSYGTDHYVLPTDCVAGPTPVPHTVTPVPSVTPSAGCDPVTHPGLTAEVSLDGTSADYANTSDCEFPISLGSYKKFNDDITQQELFDSKTDTIPPKTIKKTLKVAVPDCQFQTDAVYGGIKQPPLFGDDLLDAGGGGDKPCVKQTPTPTATATATATPVFTPPATQTVPPTATATATATRTATRTATKPPEQPTDEPTKTSTPTETPDTPTPSPVPSVDTPTQPAAKTEVPPATTQVPGPPSAGTGNETTTLAAKANLSNSQFLLLAGTAALLVMVTQVTGIGAFALGKRGWRRIRRKPYLYG